MNLFIVFFSFASFLNLHRCDPIEELSNLVVLSHKLYKKILYFRSKGFYTLEYVEGLESVNLQYNKLFDIVNKVKSSFFGKEEDKETNKLSKTTSNLAKGTSNTDKVKSENIKSGCQEFEVREQQIIQIEELASGQIRGMTDIEKPSQNRVGEPLREPKYIKNKQKGTNNPVEKKVACKSLIETRRERSRNICAFGNRNSLKCALATNQESKGKVLCASEHNPSVTIDSNLFKKKKDTIEPISKQQHMPLTNERGCSLSSNPPNPLASNKDQAETTVLQDLNDIVSKYNEKERLNLTIILNSNIFEIINKVLVLDFTVYYTSDTLLAKYKECDTLALKEIVKYCIETPGIDLSNVVEIVLLRKIMKYYKELFYQFLFFSRFCKTPLDRLVDLIRIQFQSENIRFNVLQGLCEESVLILNSHIQKIFEEWANEIKEFHNIKTNIHDVKVLKETAYKLDVLGDEMDELLNFKLLPMGLLRELTEFFKLSLNFAYLINDTIKDSNKRAISLEQMSFKALDKIIKTSFNLVEKVEKILEVHEKSTK